MSKTNERVAITGIGILSPLGLDTPTTWRRLIAGESGIDYITLFDTKGHATNFAGEVKGFDPTKYMGVKEARRMDRFAQFAVAASQEALASSGLHIDSLHHNDIGIIIGSGIGGLTTLFEQIKILLDKGPDRLSPFTVPMMIADMAAAQVSIFLGLKGPNFCTTSACSSGADAIGIGYEIIRRGDAPVMFAGGSEAVINPVGLAGFNALKALSTHNSSPKEASRPFDAEHDGFVLSEGAAVLVLENLTHARERGANIIAELISYGASADAFHMTQPIESGEGAAHAMQLAINRAGLQPRDIDYINAHGTSTPLNDRMETRAIKSVFGDYAHKIPISSTKSMTGHIIGAAGALEAAICTLAVKEGIIPPTINFHTPDPECDLDYVPNTARPAALKTVLSNSFGFGGHNSTLIIRRYEEAA
jgi:3-oxoacyl-[acyl-carrier-protein] synthase II